MSCYPKTINSYSSGVQFFSSQRGRRKKKPKLPTWEHFPNIVDRCVFTSKIFLNWKTELAWAIWLTNFGGSLRYLFYFPTLPVALSQVRLHAKIVYWKPAARNPRRWLTKRLKIFPHFVLCVFRRSAFSFRVLFYFLFLLLHFTLSLIYVSATRKHKIGVFFIWIFYSTVFSVPLNCFPAKWITLFSLGNFLRNYSEPITMKFW